MAQIRFREGEKQAIDIAFAHVYSWLSERRHGLAQDFNESFKIVRKSQAQNHTDARALVLKSWYHGFEHMSHKISDVYDMPQGTRLAYVLGANISAHTKAYELTPTLTDYVQPALKLYEQALLRQRQSN